jgi:hypothetical protein
VAGSGARYCASCSRGTAVKGMVPGFTGLMLQFADLASCCLQSSCSTCSGW